jgi:hypothetical protein
MDKEQGKAINRIGVLNILKTYNSLCQSCKLKSMWAVRRRDKNKLKNILNEYCPECKAKVMGLQK